MRFQLLTVLLTVLLAIGAAALPLAPIANNTRPSVSCDKDCKINTYAQIGFVSAQAGVALVFSALGATAWCKSQRDWCPSMTADVAVGTTEMVMNNVSSRAISDECDQSCMWQAANDISERAVALSMLTAKYSLSKHDFNISRDINGTEMSIVADATMLRLVQDNSTAIASNTLPQNSRRRRDLKSLSARTDGASAPGQHTHSSLGDVFVEGTTISLGSMADILNIIAKLFENMASSLLHKSYNRPWEIKEKREKLAKDLKARNLRAARFLNNLRYPQYHVHLFFSEDLGDARGFGPEHPLYESRTRSISRDELRKAWDRLKLWRTRGAADVEQSEASAAGEDVATFQRGLDELARSETLSLSSWLDDVDVPIYVLPDDISVLNLGEPLVPVEHSVRPGIQIPKTGPDSLVDSNEVYRESDDDARSEEASGPAKQYPGNYRPPHVSSESDEDAPPKEDPKPAKQPAPAPEPAKPAPPPPAPPAPEPWRYSHYKPHKSPSFWEELGFGESEGGEGGESGEGGGEAVAEAAVP